LKRLKDFYLKGQNLALTVMYMPNLLDSCSDLCAGKAGGEAAERVDSVPESAHKSITGDISDTLSIGGAV